MENAIYVLTVLFLVFLAVLIFLFRYLKSQRDLMYDMLVVSNYVRDKNFNIRLDNQKFKGNENISYSFNNMIDMLERSFEEIEGKNIQLNAVIQSVSSGLIVVDKYEKIYLINEPAKKILGIDEDILDGKLIYDVILERKIKKLVKNYLGTDESVNEEINLSNGTTLRVRIDPVNLVGKNEISILSVINLEDITERIKLESMRKDFVANVSHELKTPLTSISGFTETLIENDENITPSMRKRFLHIIENESSRLRILINDILTLSSIESNIDLDMDIIDIKLLNKRMFTLLKEKAKKNNISLNSEFIADGKSTDEMFFYTHEDYMKSLMINLVGNAIKYNKKDGHVNVRYVLNSSGLDIYVEDSGIGIATEELDRIFERFYRVSKSRNKDIEGTGLGLAIIKHIVSSLKGSVDVKSVYGEGSQFHVFLPTYNSLENDEDLV